MVFNWIQKFLWVFLLWWEGGGRESSFARSVISYHISILQIKAPKMVSLSNVWNANPTINNWNRQFSHHQSVAMCKMVQLCLPRCLWRERDQCSFEDCERSVLELVFCSWHLVSFDKNPLWCYFFSLIFRICSLYL